MTCVAAVVVFCTTYALILPAITLDQTGALKGDDAYISIVGMGTTDQETSNGISDGSSPWDADDSDGCDTGASNLRVRTFDTIKYDFYYTTTQQDPQDVNHYSSARVCFEFLLPVTREEAYFSVEEMSWLQADGQQVAYTYEDEMITVGGVRYQVLHGSFLDNRDGSDITAASRSRDVTVRVLNMENNSTLQPIFTVWLEQNDVGVELINSVPNGCVWGSTYICKEHEKQEYQTVRPKPVTVTCTPRYSVTLKRGESSTTSYIGDFDFSTGNDMALDKTETNEAWNGRMGAYGVRLMVKGVDKAHGLRGCEFPREGDTIEFDIRLTTAYQSSNAPGFNFITQEFLPRVWSADAFLDGTSQQDERMLQGTQVPSYAAPLNKGTVAAYSCADGGTWTFTDGGYAHDDLQRVIRVKVTDYTFDPEYLPYTHERGRVTDTEFYDPAEIGSQYWKIDEAVFSTGEIWVVTPFYDQQGKDSEHYITNVKNTGSLTMWQSIFVYDVSLNGKSLWEGEKEYDCLDTSITLQNEGRFNTYLAMIKPLGEWNQPLTDECFHSQTELKDYATPGTYTDLEVWMEHDGSEGDAGGVAYNIMAKFDDAFFEPVTKQEMLAAGIKETSTTWNSNSFPWNSHTWTIWPRYDAVPGWKDDIEHVALEPKMLYGTTRDKRGWNHDGKKPDQEGYDDEMMRAVPDDLIWYDSMEALKADGAVCVAVLMEYRNLSNDGTMSEGDTSQMNHLHMAVHGRIKDTAETGYIYAFTGYAAGWTRADVKEQARAYFNDPEKELSVWEYLKYSRNGFPSYSPSAQTRMSAETYIKPTHEWSWKRCTNNGNEEIAGNNGFGTARKSYFQDEALIAGTGGYFFLDCVYVVGYETQVGLQVAQTTSQGSSKDVYSMEAGEHVADFKITPHAVRSVEDSGSYGETVTQYGDITVQATLPRGLRYYTGTAVWGGSYQQDASAQTPGIVTGGQYMEPVIQKNEDGTSTLTWILEDIPLSHTIENLDPIYFSCHIGNADDPANDVSNNEKLPVRADIWSTLDWDRAHGSAFQNQADTSITISKSSALTIIKTADQAVVNLDQPMTFTMKVYNDSEAPYTGWIADILPRNGIGRSKYQGSALVEEFKIVRSDANLSEVTFYYTTDESYSDTRDISNLDIAGWKTFTLNKDNTWKPDPEVQGKQITAIAYQCAVPGKGIIEMKLTLRLPENRVGDVVHNRLMLNNLSSGDLCRIISRTLEGLTWLDRNADGIQDGAEVTGDGLLSGIKVSLWKLKIGGDAAREEDYEPYHYGNDPKKQKVVIETGQQISVRAAGGSAVEPYEPGRYKFTDLPPGTYAVKFQDGDGKTIISPLIASPVNQGGDEKRDSDGVASYSEDKATLFGTVILNIEMPSAEEMQVVLYESKHHDSGFYKRGYRLPDSGGSGTLPYVVGGYVLVGGTVIYLLFGRRKKGVVCKK